jgi:hypothetical protein
MSTPVAAEPAAVDCRVVAAGSAAGEPEEAIESDKAGVSMGHCLRVIIGALIAILRIL